MEESVPVVLPGGTAVTVFVTMEVIVEVEQAFNIVMEPAAATPAASPAFFRNSLREIPLSSSSLRCVLPISMAL